jgi:hypothetical protein
MGRGRHGGRPRKHPGILGVRPDLKALRQKEANERTEARVKILAELAGSKSAKVKAILSDKKKLKTIGTSKLVQLVEE